MSKPLLFYVIDERTDYIKYCKRKGMIPYKFTDKRLDGQIYKSAIQYTYQGHIYNVLNCAQCYSGYMITLMQLPKLSYEELIDIALSSTKSEERSGAIGIILKDYPNEFEQYLSSIKDIDSENLSKKNNVKRMVELINNFIKNNTSYAWSLEKILFLCEELESRLL